MEARKITEKDFIKITQWYFIWFTNSKIAWFGFPISDPKYKEKNKSEAVDILITCVEKVCKDAGSKVMFTYLNQDSNYTKGVERYKDLGWVVHETTTQMLKEIK